MKGPVLLDTGPLVALLVRQEAHHRWAQEQFAKIQPPLLTCEAVLPEACFLVRRASGGPQAVLALVSRGVVAVTFRFGAEAEAIEQLLIGYADVPMSFADACLVRMAESHARSSVLTLDRDFLIYRIHGRQRIPTIMPDDV